MPEESMAGQSESGRLAEQGTVRELSTSTLPSPRESNRLVELDAARGFALLGIVLVNVDFFAIPMGLLELPGPYETGLLPTAAAVFVDIFCKGKFYPLFALLFGIGVALQHAKFTSAGGKFTAFGLRRMAVLFLFGAAHVLVLWYGDILLFYATAGSGLVLLAGLKPVNKLRVGAGLVVVVTMLIGALSLLVAGTDVDVLELREEVRQVSVGEKPFQEMLREIDQLDGGLADPKYLAAETRAYAHGGLLQALGFRLLSFAAIVAAGVVGWWWSVLGLFLLGAGLLEWGLFEREKERYLTGFLVLAMVIGLPASALGALLNRTDNLSMWVGSLALVSPMIVGPIMALGFLSGIALMVRHRFYPGAITALAAAGRMALTNYLGQSVVLGFVFYSWGLGRFGQMPGHQRVLLAVGIFAAQVVVSGWWLQRFRFGPLEWLWRTATYGQRQPFRRAAK